ncbi:DNA cytosine methyltransferase [Paracoccus aeridis]|uniref:DNA cytosine methyltransferase n=1 Tax=Paracoccus aeridis TaxID=1966466 RepID=UPI001F2A194D|nr:DNA cytosine methyltransferase [Paracoccus aeridis]
MDDLALPSSGRASGAGDACLFGLSLCSGAGGLDLGLTIAIPGYRAVGHVERETYAAATLVARMEDASMDQAAVWDDVGTFDGRPWRGAVDIVTAGYPCQPFSVAGKRRGADDPRHLWPHVARIIGEAEPPFVFLENVAHHLRLGFPEVAGGLVGMGYRLAAGLFTAAEVGAPHKREGQRRRFDWRDLACLAVMRVLRKHSLSLDGMALFVSDLRDDLAGMNDISDISGRSFFCADWGKKQPCPTVGLVTETDLFAVLKRRPETVIIVDVATVYRDAAGAIPVVTAAGGAAL